MRESKWHPYRPSCLLLAEGPDAREYLQGQFSANLGGSQGGEAVYGLWLDRKGKIVADSFVLCHSPDLYWLASYYSDPERTRQRLEQYLIMDEVEIREGPAVDAVALWGVAAMGVAESFLGQPLPKPRRWTSAKGAMAFWGRRGAEPVLEILARPDADVACIEELKTELGAAGVAEASDEEVASLAIEAVVPRVGVDIGDRDLPQEVGLVEGAVAFDKGCYLGQEVMARLRSMGRARRRMARVRLDGPAISLPADLFDSEGKKRGELRSQAKLDSGYAGLAIAPVGWQEPLRLPEPQQGLVRLEED